MPMGTTNRGRFDPSGVASTAPPMVTRRHMRSITTGTLLLVTHIQSLFPIPSTKAEEGNQSWSTTRPPHLNAEENLSEWD